MKLASISAGLANGEGKLVDVVDKNRSINHNDNKSHPNGDIDDSQSLTASYKLNYSMSQKKCYNNNRIISIEGTFLGDTLYKPYPINLYRA